MAAQYKVYDRVRSKRAFEVAGEPGTAPDFEHMRGARQALVVSFKRAGTPVPTPVNFGLDDDGRLFFRSEPDTAKIRRIKRDPHVRVAPCGLFAKPHGPTAEGTARVLPPEESERAHAALEANWTPGMRLFEKGAERIGIDAVYVEVTPA